MGTTADLPCAPLYPLPENLGNRSPAYVAPLSPLLPEGPGGRLCHFSPHAPCTTTYLKALVPPPQDSLAVLPVHLPLPPEDLGNRSPAYVAPLSPRPLKALVTGQINWSPLVNIGTRITPQLLALIHR